MVGEKLKFVAKHFILNVGNYALFGKLEMRMDRAKCHKLQVLLKEYLSLFKLQGVYSLIKLIGAVSYLIILSLFVLQANCYSSDLR